MSVDEKIRRAEEIYYKRRESNIPRTENIREVSHKRKDIKLFKKMIIQIIICLIIYSVFYSIINNNYIFSEDFTNSAKQILSKDIDFSQIYNIIVNKINELFPEEKQQETTNSEQVENQTSEENIGGAEEILTGDVQENVESQIEETPQISQMEQDANYIKETINFIKPLTGKITSKYGLRNPTTASVPKNHTGTDIAADVGTKIISATNGTVILDSTQGDYGKHLKIQTGDVIIVYAHCNNLYVKTGDNINQGQEIAEVGATGNVTGPHLHFEIRYQDRYVDPEMILEL